MFGDYGALVEAWGNVSWFQTENSCLKVEIAELRQANEDLEFSVDELGTGYMEKFAEATNLEDENRLMQIRVSELLSENSKKDAIIQELEAHNDSQDGSIQSLKLQLNATEISYNSNLKRLTDIVEQVSSELNIISAYLEIDANVMPRGPIPTS